MCAELVPGGFLECVVVGMEYVVDAPAFCRLTLRWELLSSLHTLKQRTVCRLLQRLIVSSFFRRCSYSVIEVSGRSASNATPELAGIVPTEPVTLHCLLLLKRRVCRHISDLLRICRIF